MPIALMIGMMARRGGGGGPGPVYDPDAEALWATFTNQPSTAVKAAYNDVLVVPLKEANLWDKLDILHVWDTLDSQWARQNVLLRTSAASLVSSPVHTPKQGIQGDGATSYVNLNYNPADGGSWRYIQNDAHIGLWSRTDLNGAVADIGARSGGTAAQACLLLRVSSAFSPRVNLGGAPPTPSVGNSLGHFVGSRAGGDVLAFKDGSSLGTTSVASSVFYNGSWYLGAVNNSGSAMLHSSRQYQASHAGSGFTLEDHQGMHAILDNWHTAISAIV